MFDMEEELAKLPDQPGVYLMRDESDAIIYVGKAKSLTKRVHQYFQKSHDEGPKKQQMVAHIARFEYIVTDSETEALILECNLIKEHAPKYNTLLRDDKTYPYIKVTVKEAYPRVLFTRQVKRDGSRYFGPYGSASSVRETIDLIESLYHLRSCSRVLPRDQGKERPCLNYQMHRCDAPCQGWISPKDYQKSVDEALLFLSGRFDGVLAQLQEKMQAASDAMRYELAAEYRDRIDCVRAVAQKQKVTESGGADRDVIGLACDGEDAVAAVFFIRDGKLIGRDHFQMSIGAEEETGDILTDFVQQFYAGTPMLPREIMLPEALAEAPLLEEWLSQKRGGKVSLLTPQRGEKEQLVELAVTNAQMILTQDKEKIRQQKQRDVAALHELENLLHLSPLFRMEAFDISDISGFDPVGSMVVYEDGSPKRSDYRKFRLRTVTQQNDYACMREMLTRRFVHGMEERARLSDEEDAQNYGSFTRFPDLILVDGGKGQVHIAESVLDELSLNVLVCGMVKDDRHHTRALYFQDQEVPMQKNSEAFLLITRIQDEVHRFAVEYHRSLRGKAQVHSVLDDIEGIGPARRKALLFAFGSAEAVGEASVEELSSVSGMTKAAAESVYHFFHENEQEHKRGEMS